MELNDWTDCMLLVLFVAIWKFMGNAMDDMDRLVIHGSMALFGNQSCGWQEAALDAWFVRSG